VDASAAAGEEVTREEVRPGLTMVRRRTRKEDGRYLLYYDFERSGAPAGARAESEREGGG